MRLFVCSYAAIFVPALQAGGPKELQGIAMTIDILTENMAHLASYPSRESVPLPDWRAVHKYVGLDKTLMAKVTHVAGQVAHGLHSHVKKNREVPLSAALIMERTSEVMKFIVEASSREDGAPPPRQVVTKLLSDLALIAASTPANMKRQNVQYFFVMKKLIWSDARAAFYRLFADQTLLRVLDTESVSMPFVDVRLVEFRQWLKMKPHSHDDVIAAIDALHDQIRMDLRATLVGYSLDRKAHYQDMKKPFVKIF